MASFAVDVGEAEACASCVDFGSAADFWNPGSVASSAEVASFLLPAVDSVSRLFVVAPESSVSFSVGVLKAGGASIAGRSITIVKADSCEAMSAVSLSVVPIAKSEAVRMWLACIG